MTSPALDASAVYIRKLKAEVERLGGVVEHYRRLTEEMANRHLEELNGTRERLSRAVAEKAALDQQEES